MAAVQDGRDKLIKTAVEKILFTDCQNLQAHSCSVYLWRHKNKPLLKGGHMLHMHVQSSPHDQTLSDCVIIDVCFRHQKLIPM